VINTIITSHDLEESAVYIAKSIRRQTSVVIQKSVVKMEDLSLSSVLDAFHFYSTNESFAWPGVYDISVQDASWALASTLGMFTMQTGLALLEVGIVGSKNRVNVMMKNM
jgi:hypothetical protein